jgi:hypothetical protein
MAKDPRTAGSIELMTTWINENISRLNNRERKVLSLRFGFCIQGFRHSRAMIAKLLRITEEEVAEIEEEGLGKFFGYGELELHPFGQLKDLDEFQDRDPFASLPDSEKF